MRIAATSASASARIYRIVADLDGGISEPLDIELPAEDLTLIACALERGRRTGGKGRERNDWSGCAFASSDPTLPPFAGRAVGAALAFRPKP